MKDYLSIIRKPIAGDLDRFNEIFAESLHHTDGQLDLALKHILQRSGKRMRPILVLLMAKAFGGVNDVALYGGAGLELLHTASLVHDDVVDEADKRRGQLSLNALFDNKVSVLVGDYILSAALLSVCKTNTISIVQLLSELGQTLSEGEILQLTANDSSDISEDTYYRVITLKTAALFEACCAIGTIAVGASQDVIEASKSFGRNLGIIFQIRDDIFDYFPSDKVGKPTGNDMREGKLTLPAIYAVLQHGDDHIKSLAMAVKQHKATAEDIAELVAFTKANGGIEYAEQAMQKLYAEALQFVDERVEDPTLKTSLTAYLDFVIERSM